MSTEQTVRPENGEIAEKMEEEEREVNANCCVKCDANVMQPQQYQHVMIRHLPEKKIFCGYCTHGDKFQAGNVKTHIRKCHRKLPIKLDDRREDFREQGEALLKVCFPQTRRSGRRAPRLPTIGEAKAENGDGEGKMRLRSRQVPTVGDEAGGGEQWASRNTLVCNICGPVVGQNGRRKKRHAIRCHVSVKKFLCPLCPYGSRLSRQCVQRHLALRHTDAESKGVVDNSAAYRAAVTETIVRCFYAPPSSGRRERPLQEDDDEDGRLRCRECDGHVTVAGVKSHVMTKHVPGNKVHCPYCEFGSTYAKPTVERHVSSCHRGEPIAVIDKIAEFNEEYRRVKLKCFPKNGSNRYINGARHNYTFVRCTECDVVMNQRHGNVHVLRRHIKQAPFACPYCTQFGGYFRYTTNAHILRCHPGMPERCVDRHSQFRQRVRQLSRQLFERADAPMSTRRSATDDASKPFCRVCRLHVPNSVKEHLLVYHLSVSTVECGHCGKGDKTSARNIHVHSAHKHPHLPLSTVDKRQWFKPLVKLFYAKCFIDNSQLTSNDFDLD